MVTIYTTARNVEYYTNNHETLWSNFSAPGPVAEHDGERATRRAATSSSRTSLRSTRRSTRIASAGDGSGGGVGKRQSDRGSWRIRCRWIRRRARGITTGRICTFTRRTARMWRPTARTYSYVTASSPSFTTWDNAKVLADFRFARPGRDLQHIERDARRNLPDRQPLDRAQRRVS